MTTKQNKVKRIPLSVWLTYLLIVTVIFTGVTFSGYVTTVEGGDEARVAQHAFKVSGGGTDDWSINIDGLKKPGDSVTANFTVSNKDSKISEVTMGYRIDVQAEGSIPLICKLTKGTEDVVINVNNEGSVGGQLSDSYVAKPEDYLTAGSEDSDSYTLTLTWPSDKNDIAYAEGNRLVVLRVSVLGEQID